VARVIEEEPRWRHKPVVPALAGPPQRVIATRWRAFQRHTLEVQAESTANFHVIGIALRRINIRLSFCGRVVQDGVFMPGMLIVNEPSLAIHGLLRGPTDVLHLHIPNEVLVECASHIHPRGTATLPSGSSTARDPAIERLGMALLGADDLGSPFGRLYADSISIAIVTRLLDTARRKSPADRAKASVLAPWRLKRAIDYIDANLSEPVSLAELAGVAGLTRMHFAAQFRAATGLRPHEYLLRRRVERAQELLRGSNESIMEVALQVGFQAQAHFTTTFKRFVGQPPRTWRREQDPKIRGGFAFSPEPTVIALDHQSSCDP
jgi:AraC family transcriptional regulator